MAWWGDIDAWLYRANGDSVYKSLFWKEMEILFVLYNSTEGNTQQSDTKENVIFQLLKMIIQFWKKFLEDILNRFCLF